MRLVIVGGVAAGMSAAARARRLDESAEIIVLEQGPYISYATCGLPYYVGDEITDADSLTIQTPDSLRASLNLDVRPRHRVAALDPTTRTLTVETDNRTETITYDELLLAVGTTPVLPPIDGLNSPRVHALRTVPDAIALKHAAESSSAAVVIGAGFVGLEVAEALSRLGVSTIVAEMADHPLPPLEPEMASLVTRELARLGITCVTGTAVTDITRGAQCDTVTFSDGARAAAQIIVPATGVRPDTMIFERAGVACDRGYILIDRHGRTNLAHVWSAGDAATFAGAPPVALAGPASRAGRLVADAIMNPATARELPNPLGTSILRIGSLTAAMTGANRASLDAADISYTTIHVHSTDHVTYYPGAKPLHLLVHVEKGTNQILGAQCVGHGGVDKRIDVIATAMRAGLTAPDLINLDLAYSPIYGHPKDPVTMIGLVADNVATGRLTLWQAKDVRQVMEDHLILDVRRPDEFATGHLRGAINIPHTELRARINEVRSAANGRPVAVMCASGVRSYIAHRILVAAGIDSSSLSGGMQTLRATLAKNDNLLSTTS